MCHNEGNHHLHLTLRGPNHIVLEELQTHMLLVRLGEIQTLAK